MKTITIKKSNLIVEDINNGDTITIESENGSGLYYGTNQDGEEIRLTRNELKKIGNINKIDETLEQIRNMELEKVYTDDMLNFITESELKKLSDDYQKDYEKIDFVVEKLVMSNAKKEYDWMKTEEFKKFLKEMENFKGETFEDILSRYLNQGHYYKTKKGVQEIKTIKDALKAAGIREHILTNKTGLYLRHVVRLAIALDFTEEDINKSVAMATPETEETYNIPETKHWTKSIININKKYKMPEEFEDRIDVESTVKLFEDKNFLKRKEKKRSKVK